MALESNQPRQRRVPFFGLGVLDQQRRNQFTRGSNQLVVRVDLVLNRFPVRHFLRPDHFLDLVPRGLHILENKGKMRPDVQAAPLLLMNEQRPQPVAHAFVVSQRQYFVGRDFLHRHSPCGGGTASGKPSRWYARASTSIGCIGCTPVACSICTAASGQSVAITRAAALRIPLKAFSPHFIDSAKNSFFIAHVPSCAVHASTVVTSTPGIWRIKSRERSPIACAFR